MKITLEFDGEGKRTISIDVPGNDDANIETIIGDLIEPVLLAAGFHQNAGRAALYGEKVVE